MTPTTDDARRVRRLVRHMSNALLCAAEDKATKPSALLLNTRGAVREERQDGISRRTPPTTGRAALGARLGVEPRAEHAGLARERHGDGRRRDERAERPRRDGGGLVVRLRLDVERAPIPGTARAAPPTRSSAARAHAAGVGVVDGRHATSANSSARARRARSGRQPAVQGLDGLGLVAHRGEAPAAFAAFAAVVCARETQPRRALDPRERDRASPVASARPRRPPTAAQLKRSTRARVAARRRARARRARPATRVGEREQPLARARDELGAPAHEHLAPVAERDDRAGRAPRATAA